MEISDTECNKSNKRYINNSLNVIKCIAAFSVICIHCHSSLSSVFGKEIVAISRFAVPIFFLISGYYSFYNDNLISMNKYKMRIIKLLKLLILTNAGYIFLFFLNQLNNPLKITYGLWNLREWVNYFVFNQTPEIAGGHLWFVQALIYCYILFLILKKFSPLTIKKLYKITPILLLINIILCEISTICGINFSVIHYRNFLFTGLPFFVLGYFIHDNEKYLIDNISDNWIICTILLSLILIMCTVLITGIDVVHVDLYAGSIPLALGIFLFCIKNPNKLNLKIMGWIGGNLYMYIYILHPIIIGMVVNRLNLGHLNPITVFVITTMFSYIAYIINKKLKIL